MEWTFVRFLKISLNGGKTHNMNLLNFCKVLLLMYLDDLDEAIEVLCSRKGFESIPLKLEEEGRVLIYFLSSFPKFVRFSGNI